MWMLDSLDEDQEWEHFFSGLPGFCSLKYIHNPLPTLAYKQKKNLLEALIGFLECSFSSDLLGKRVKDQRAIIYTKAFNPVYFSKELDTFDGNLSRYQYCGPIVSKVLQHWMENRLLLLDISINVILKHNMQTI